jgi:hypothetical protein
MISSGEYSDYQVYGVFRPLKNFTMREALAKFLGYWLTSERAKSGEDLESTPYPDEFIAWLAAEGYIEDIKAQEFHIGSYGSLEMSNETLNYQIQGPQNGPTS